MNPDRWQQISQLYHAALTRNARDRSGFLREACAGDDALQQEVESLLSNEAAGFLSGPASSCPRLSFRNILLSMASLNGFAAASVIS